jgi:hypothetical protein
MSPSQAVLNNQQTYIPLAFCVGPLTSYNLESQ